MWFTVKKSLKTYATTHLYILFAVKIMWMYVKFIPCSIMCFSSSIKITQTFKRAAVGARISSFFKKLFSLLGFLYRISPKISKTFGLCFSFFFFSLKVSSEQLQNTGIFFMNGSLPYSKFLNTLCCECFFRKTYKNNLETEWIKT